jgi:hypothetical protein
MPWKITTDPDDPGFREALRKQGAPDWYPDNAPVHVFEYHDHYPDYIEVRCPICGWTKRNHLGPDGSIEHVDDGEPWVIHRPPEGGFSNIPGATLKVDGLKVTEPELWEELFPGVSDEQEEE